MNEIIAILVFVVWYTLSLIISEYFGKNTKPGVEWIFFISMIFSPFAGYLLVRLTSISKKSS
ncbi:MAG: hypothetical protein P1P88_18130 [Bacteroidales bacterium]|nr:hypothetical protein [Bacteroidales bacterium]